MTVLWLMLGIPAYWLVGLTVSTVLGDDDVSAVMLWPLILIILIAVGAVVFVATTLQQCYEWTQKRP